MAKKIKDFRDYEFKFVDFNDREKDDYSRWINKFAFDPVDALGSIAEERCKVSVSLDPNSGAWTLYVTPKDPEKPVYGNIYVYRHNDLSKTILIGLYHFVEVLQRGEVNPDVSEGLDW